MFQKSAMSPRENGNEPETIIAPSVKVEGDFVSEGNVLIEGMVEGSLKTSRDLRVGERARISADVAAANAVVAGEIRGNIVISERLELEPTAKIYGDVKTKVFIVSSGASVNGRISMDETEERSVKSSRVEKGKHSEPVLEKEEALAHEEKPKVINTFFTR